MGKKIEENDFSLNASPFTPSSSLFASLFSDKRTKEKKNNGAQSSLFPHPFIRLPRCPLAFPPIYSIISRKK